VIGDSHNGIFVRRGVPELIKERALPAADIITPNQFELEFLSGGPVGNAEQAHAGLAKLHTSGPKVILITSLHLDDTPADCIDIAASQPGAVWRVRTPRLDISVNGAGDCMAALFFVHWLTTQSVKLALERAVAAVFGLLSRTAEAKARELLLVAAQDEFAAPTRCFEALPL
jgi:pyridoxine kinase